MKSAQNGFFLRRMLLLLLCALSAGVSCTNELYYQIGGYAQGGTYSVKYRGAKAAVADVQEGVDSLLREIDFNLSGYNKSSLLSRLNRGDSVVISPMMARIYRESYRFWEESGGAFDISAGALFDIWGFGFKSGEMPSDALVRETLTSCGMSRLISPDMMDAIAQSGRLIVSSDLLREDAAGETPPVLNFNAIAQGFSCDLVYEYLKGLGATDMLVDIGEIRCCGLNPSGKGWSIGIDNPEDGNDTPGKDLRGIWDSEGRDCGIVTSGNYRKFYIRDGVKYSHTIDPRDGYPVRHSLLSATVVAPTATEADALATAFMVMGYDASMEYLSSRPDLQACLITSDLIWSSWQ